MSEFRRTRWLVKELALPAIVRACVSCRSDRHHPTGKVRVNASGKLLDVWLLIGCASCGRTSKIPVHERVHVRHLDHDRLVRFENNDPAMVRHLAMDTALAGRSAYRLDWTDTWHLETDVHPCDVPAEVTVRFELPAPIRVEKLLTAGLGRSRAAVRHLVESGRVVLPMALDVKVREDFTLFVTG